MVQHSPMLTVADNSGAKKIMVIGIPAKGRSRTATLGEIITGVVKTADPRGNVKSAEIVKAVLVRARKEIKREDGSYIRFSDNAVVVVDKDKNPRATRIFGPIAREVKDKGFTKIISMASEVV